LQLRWDEPLANFAFRFSFRCYITEKELRERRWDAVDVAVVAGVE
jgi:hypothetical protein